MLRPGIGRLIGANLGLLFWYRFSGPCMAPLRCQPPFFPPTTSPRVFGNIEQPQTWKATTLPSDHCSRQLSTNTSTVVIISTFREIFLFCFSSFFFFPRFQMWKLFDRLRTETTWADIFIFRRDVGFAAISPLLPNGSHYLNATQLVINPALAG